MKNAYALLGLAFIVVFGAAYILFDRAYAPTTETLSESNALTMPFTLTSSAFSDQGSIPSQYTCDGEGTLPPLSISNAPEGTVAFALVMDDLDIPNEFKEARGIQKFDHYAVYNIPPDTEDISRGIENAMPALNSQGNESYLGPCPPSEYEPKEHRYIFRLYALSEPLEFENTPTLDEVEAAAKEHMIAETELTGRYARP